eukprot:TRINITY_DN1274_c0_g2_i1.p1 TRINITY_DN1274_c0_g2~~TRINITY_DN1274_c0_g2_i1.p1  ORF type:complete len:569 (-),score=54.26 TRINITY_DN1274_c0_g2_i1:157-1863(-)
MRCLSKVFRSFSSLECPAHASYVVRKTPRFTPAQRLKVLEKVEYNVFNFPSLMVAVDLMSDSGTPALYQSMWSGIMMADESYSRNTWYYAFLDSLRDFCQRGDQPKKLFKEVLSGENSFEWIMKVFEEEGKANNITGFVNGGIRQMEAPNTFILPQGRCCETVLFQCLRYYFQKPEPLVLSNGLFETTKINAEVAGFKTLDLFSPDILAPFELERVGKENPFRGNIDLGLLEHCLSADKSNVALLVMTLTNNTGAGHPVSVQNLISARKLCDKYGVPLWIDAARIAENAAFIQKYEAGYNGKSIAEILRLLFSLCDGFHFSLKKALCNMGGVICLRDSSAFCQKFPKIGTLMRKCQLLSYGHDSYGGMSGRDLAAATLALHEVSKPDYLFSRLSQTKYLAVGLAKSGLPVCLPPGGHAVYIDVNEMFKGRKWDDFMGVGLVVELLEKYGIRGTELGYMAMELDKYHEKHKKLPERMPPNFVRLAMPANAYGKEHMDYVIAAMNEINKNKDKVKAFRISRGKDVEGRYFSAGLEPKSQQQLTIELTNFAYDNCVQEKYVLILGNIRLES